MYHIKIEDLRTGKIVTDVVSDCIIAVINHHIIHNMQSITCISAQARVIKLAIASAKKQIRFVKRELRAKR